MAVRPALGGAPGGRVRMPAEWVSDGSCFVLRVTAASVRQAWSPLLICISLALGTASALIALTAGSDLSGAVLTGLLIAATCLTLVGYLRLSLQARELRIGVGPRSLTIVDDGSLRVALALDDIDRVLIVHDGAPARIAIASAQGRFTWTIGHLYRHNTVERCVAEMPAEAGQWLSAAGLTGTSSTYRGVLRTEYRR